MSVRLLLDPAPTDGGGTTPTPPVTPPPAAVAPPATPPATPPAEQMIPVPFAEYSRLRDADRLLGEFKANEKEKLEAKETERLKVLAEKEGVERALAEQKERLTKEKDDERAERLKLDRSYLDEKRGNVVAELLGGYKLRPHAAGFVRRELEGRLSATRDAAGTIAVRDANGRTAADVVKDVMGSPEFALFLEPSSAGGAGGSGTTPPADPQPDAPAVNMGLQIIQAARAKKDNLTPPSMARPSLDFTPSFASRN